MLVILISIVCMILSLNAEVQESKFNITIPELEKYAATLPEFPQSSDINWIDPDYSSFYHTITPSFFKRMLRKIKIMAEPVISPELLSDVLDTLILQRKELEFDKKTSALVTATEGSTFFVWGDTHAAFHSLLRDLVWLSQQGIIDNNLRIKNENTFFVFHGDQISRGVYSLETLNIIVLLMYHNPNNVFYIAGNHESKGYWQNFGLKRELKIRGYYLSDNSWLPIANKINDFFGTLENELYINMIQDPSRCILFKFNGLDVPYFRQPPFSNKIGTFHDKPFVNYKYKEDRCFVIDALIKTEDWMQEHRAHDGLGQLDQIYGITTWAVLSSPITIHMQYYNFPYDAFATIKIGSTIRHSTIGVINRSVKEADSPFKAQIPYNIVTGRPITLPNPEPVGEDIVLGSSMSLVQGVPVMGERAKRGASLAINQANKEGGIGGRHIKLDIRNDNYVPFVARKNIQEFVEKNITDIILIPIGSPTLDAYFDYITDNKIAVFFPLTGAAQFTDPKLTSIINLTATYEDELRFEVDYVIKQHATRKFGFFYQEDGDGTSCMEVMRTLLPQYGIKKWIEMSYTRGRVNFSEQIKTLRDSQVDALAFFSTSYAAQEFIRQIGIERLLNRTLFGISFLGDEPFKEFAKSKGLNVLLMARFPNPNTSDLPIVKEYREVMTATYYPTDNVSLETYIATKLMIDVMKKIDGEITKNSIMDYMVKIKDLDFGGFKLDFDPATRGLTHKVWLETGHNSEWIEG